MITTSEWVSLGHPDKIADYISEYILDRFLARDKYVRYALEVQVKDNTVNLAGEVTSTYKPSPDEYEKWTKDAIRKIGYTDDYAFDWGYENAICPSDVIVNTFISRQSPDIAVGVDKDTWGDQGIFFGMAMKNNYTYYMPKDIYLARKFGNALFRRDFCGLDIKTQVTLKGHSFEELVIAAPILKNSNAESNILETVTTICEIENLSFPKNLIINGTGEYVKHSSMGDCGTTGRKLAVDFYGGNCEIGGGSPWTKDYSKADLSLNAYARKLAVDFVKSTNEYPGVKVKLSCSIGSDIVYITYLDLHGNVISSDKTSLPPSKVVAELGFNKCSFAELCETGLPYAII